MHTDLTFHHASHHQFKGVADYISEHGLMFDDEKTPRGALLAMLAFHVAPGVVDTCTGEFERKGFNLVAEPTNQSWGHRTMFVRGRDGNVVEIYADI